MTDADALLLALIRRKAPAEPLADLLLAHPAVAAGHMHVLAVARSRTLWASVRYERGGWFRLAMIWGRGERPQTAAYPVHLNLNDPRAGWWLAYYLRSAFIRRPRKRAA